MTAPVLPNGVNAPAVVAYAQHLEAAAPEDGTRFAATVHWDGGFRNQIRVRDLAPTTLARPTDLRVVLGA